MTYRNEADVLRPADEGYALKGIRWGLSTVEENLRIIQDQCRFEIGIDRLDVEDPIDDGIDMNIEIVDVRVEDVDSMLPHVLVKGIQCRDRLLPELHLMLWADVEAVLILIVVVHHEVRDRLMDEVGLPTSRLPDDHRTESGPIGLIEFSWSHVDQKKEGGSSSNILLTATTANVYSAYLIPSMGRPA